jgi:hypothetical protein
MPDGQLVVLHGQAECVETVWDETCREMYRTTIDWRYRHRFVQSRLQDAALGVELRDEDTNAGREFRLAPLLDDPDQ